MLTTERLAEIQQLWIRYQTEEGALPWRAGRQELLDAIPELLAACADTIGQGPRYDPVLTIAAPVTIADVERIVTAHVANLRNDIHNGRI